QAVMVPEASIANAASAVFATSSFNSRSCIRSLPGEHPHRARRRRRRASPVERPLALGCPCRSGGGTEPARGLLPSYRGRHVGPRIPSLPVTAARRSTALAGGRRHPRPRSLGRHHPAIKKLMAFHH